MSDELQALGSLDGRRFEPRSRYCSLGALASATVGEDVENPGLSLDCLELSSSQLEKGNVVRTVLRR